MQRSLHSGTHCEAIEWRGVLDDSVRQAWCDLLSRIPEAPIFYYPKWCELSALAKAIHPWRILLVWRNDRLIGLVPLQKRSPWCAEITAFFAQYTPPLLIDPTAEDICWSVIADWMRQEKGLGMISFGPGSTDRRARYIEQAFTSSGMVTSSRQLPATMRIALPAHWEDYLISLGKNTRRNLKQSEARLRRDFADVEIDMMTGEPACSAALPDLIRLFRKRWQNQVGGSPLHDVRNTQAYTAIIRWAAQHGFLVMPVLRIDGNVIAILTVFHIPGQQVAYCHTVARDVDALPSSYSPGMVLYSNLLNQMISRGVTCVDFGHGNAFYKQLLGGQELTVREICVVRSRLASILLPTIERSLYIARRLPVHLAYHLRSFSSHESI